MEGELGSRKEPIAISGTGHYSPTGKSLLRLGWVLLAAAGAAQRWAPSQWVEQWYVPRVYSSAARLLSALSGRFRYSLSEVLTSALLTGGLVLGVHGLWRPGNRVRRAYRALLTTLSAAGYATFAFSLLWGLNYRRPPLAERLRLPVGGTPEELVDTARWLACETARLSPPGEKHQPTQCPHSPEALHAQIEEAFARTKEISTLRGHLAPAKPVFFSNILSRLGLSGIYIPFTGEPNYNRLLPDAERVFAIAHEKAHQRGIAPESEANFAAFLALRASLDPYLRYCAYLNATGYLLRAVQRADPKTYGELAPILEGRPAADFAAIGRFWQAYRGPAQHMARRVNDAYLRLQRVSGGVQNYDAVTDLLVGYYRTHH